ncbi:MAG: Rrf2 family transcriptional regulator [Furfurilactobacillus sp.]|jgi:Rrf2 family protein|uniref:Rrf2 family transcriptional regulator n=1 Tax=Furfurilactobacillus milii TaxID=2888272 RepID=A0ABT6D9J8_9LACO|nr:MULTISPECIES: Rrf2 family transcriptional regulator [Furfurilactobacillus]QLE65808.1 Rrf2 transcriptional regulator group III [Furfurilactobacillus rossiae]MCF6160281.1 Rrf2 family transcriptional regulator [Furfurilactobacillus milii]MCF6162224.1 Rrf2 family transcriptional regulator [Furfurilactobacillus milii]MCF6420433.1 Rrf2 family transcriptional regulator [Furfurilactobacillus milii]MCH4012332.1 Rrf2 family transcriptional regulator [Furfurilactobacillus sp.]
MKYSYRLSDGVHILAYISIAPTASLSSTSIAASIEANPSVVRKLMVDLKNAGLLTTKNGSAEPRLARSADDITLLDVYRAVEASQNILHVDPRTNMQCPVGANIQETLNGVYDRVQQAAEQEMQAITLTEIIDGIQERRRQSL